MATKSAINPPELTVQKRPDGVAVVTLDIVGESQNTLQAALLPQFEAIFSDLDKDDSVVGIVFCSGKPDSFIAGADVSMLSAVTTASDAAALSTQSQKLFERLEQFRAPVVAAINGACLGGGLELALACSQRIASDSPKTLLGLPEVQLGLLPGAGGTQRLPRLIGIANALDLMLTGKHVRAAKAKKLGLVNEVVRPSLLIDAAIRRVLELSQAKGDKSTPLGKLSARLKEWTTPEGISELALEENPIGRAVLFQQARKKLSSKTNGNYPAPEAILSVVEVGYSKGLSAGFAAEAQAFGNLVVSPEARSLMSIFFAVNQLKKDSGVDNPAVKPRTISKVGILGAGLMGAGIAYVTASKANIPVRMKDRDDEAVARGMKSVRDLVEKRVQRRTLTRFEAHAELLKVTATTDYVGMESCPIVIEAVFEDLALKHQMIRDIEALSHPDVIFASNTSSIPIGKIAQGSRHPETVVGMHYFSPVDKMPLLEVITTDKTADWVTATVVELGKKQGKTVIVVRDGVGFYTSRILAPYMNEAAQILSEGVPIEHIDRALEKWGYPVGPITLLDEVGIDVAAKVGPIMLEAFGDRLNPPPVMTRLVNDDRKGRKNKKGFYKYTELKKKGRKEVDTSVYTLLGINPQTTMNPTLIAERCALLMINEAALCLQEGIIRSPRDGDIGAIFGLGFPPFRGGPFRFADQVGITSVVTKMQDFAGRFGSRFSPASILLDMSKRNTRFYSD